MAGVALAGISLIACTAALRAQDAGARPPAAASAGVEVSVPAGSLERGVLALGRQINLRLLYPSRLTAGRSTAGVSGRMTPNQAVARLLAGTGLQYRFIGPATVQISDGAAAGGAAAGGAPEGAIALDTIDVSGGRVAAAEEPYRTPGAVSHIAQESIERFRGSSPADIFRGTPGVLSGESRNGGGGIDVNIRGMQGMGRVAVTVDGAENGVSIYQGYQGASNRTFVDPDLLAGIDIQKGSNVASRGMAGTVTMRTLSADDIIEQGRSWGVRLKGEAGSNSSSPVPGSVGGYRWPSSPGAAPVAVPSGAGMERPNLFGPTQGSGSIVTAWREENFDILVGYAHRSRGNYHAGTNGPSARPQNVGPRTLCNAYNYCQTWPNYVDNAGITNYRAGEQVLNTQLETRSWLAKGNLRFEGGHSLQFGYTGYRSEAGDLLASRFTDERSQPTQQAQTTGTRLDSGTLRYRWKPEGNDLIDLKANLWMAYLELRNPRRGSTFPTPQSLGLPANFRTGSDTRMWGGDVTNTSLWTAPLGTVKLTYGASYLTEDTRPSAYSNELEGWLNLRDAVRRESGTFGKLEYKPFEWLTLNGGLRYSHYWSDDRRTWANSPDQLNPRPHRNEGGFSPSVGVTVEPVRGLQLYANYSNALRFPSLMEEVSTFTLIPNPNLRPERSSNWEIGANVTRNGIFAENDKAMLKFGYFNWNVSNYIAREFRQYNGVYWGMQIFNIDSAKFQGLEFSGRYQNGGFTLELAANYFLGIQYCRTADSCVSSTFYGDYATNHVPPKYMVSLTASQKFLDDALTLGGRITHYGPRAIEHGAITAQGLSSFIAQINWKPYTMVDVFAEYKVTANVTANFRIENLMDVYYVDPLGLVNQPGPGRTVYAGVTAKF
jgi:hemoglobin/transferrin/lactoferrin receptor protein